MPNKKEDVSLSDILFLCLYPSLFVRLLSRFYKTKEVVKHYILQLPSNPFVRILFLAQQETVDLFNELFFRKCALSQLRFTFCRDEQ